MRFAKTASKSANGALVNFVNSRKAKPQDGLCPRRHGQAIDRRCLGSELPRIDGLGIAVNHVVMKGVLHIPIAVIESEDAAGVGFIVRKH